MTITAAQRRNRRHGIGGSDAPIIVGASNYKTPLALYLEKIDHERDGEIEVPSLSMRTGTALEPVIIDEWQRRHGRRIVTVQDTLRHPQFEWMLAHIDGVVDYDYSDTIAEGFEAKYREFQSDDWGAPGTDEVPADVAIQCHHYMAVTGAVRWHVGAQFGGRRFESYVIERNDEIIGALVGREIEFWRMVESRTPPPMTVAADANLLFRTSKAASILATPEIERELSRLAFIKREIEGLEGVRDSIENAIKAHMGECDTLIDMTGRVLATWKSSKDATRIDLDALRAAMPEVARQFTVTKPGSRRFITKGK